MAQQPQQQFLGAVQGLGGPRGWNNPMLHELQSLGLMPSSQQNSGSPTALQPPSADGFDPSGDNDSDDPNNPQNAARQQMQQELQQLQQEIEQLIQQLQQDIQNQDQQGQSNDQQQLAQDMAALQQLTGGGSGGGGGIPSGGGGGGGIPSSGGGGGGGTSGAGSAGSGGTSGTGGTSGGSSFDGASTSASPQSVQQNADIVAKIAKQDGVDPTLAVADMLTESGGSNGAVGDGGTSFGLFQLHEGGELGSHNQAWAEDPTNNASTALANFAKVQQQTGLTGPALALKAQGASPNGYEAAVQSHWSQAQQLVKSSGV